jgi:hypothetical protein
MAPPVPGAPPVPKDAPPVPGAPPLPVTGRSTAASDVAPPAPVAPPFPVDPPVPNTAVVPPLPIAPPLPKSPSGVLLLPPQLAPTTKPTAKRAMLEVSILARTSLVDAKVFPQGLGRPRGPRSGEIIAPTRRRKYVSRSAAIVVCGRPRDERPHRCDAAHPSTCATWRDRKCLPLLTVFRLRCSRDISPSILPRA